MAKKNVELKAETLRRIRAIIEDCGGIKKIKPNQLRNNKQYITLQKNFMNKYERHIADEVIADIYGGRTDDEIMLMVKEQQDTFMAELENNERIKSDKLVDEMEQATEAMFIKSKNRVVDGPIIIDTTAEIVDEDTKNDSIKDTLKASVASTVEAGLKDAKDTVVEAVNEAAKNAKEKIDECVDEIKHGADLAEGMLLLSKGAIVSSDGTTENISDTNDDAANVSEHGMIPTERFDMMMAKYKQPLIDRVGTKEAERLLRRPVDWDRVINTIENGPFNPADFLIGAVNRGLVQF